MSADFFFWLGFQVYVVNQRFTRDFAKVTKMAHGGKPFFLFGYVLMSNGESPLQLTTLNVKVLYVFFLTYPWVLTTGNLPPEILVILT